MSSKLLEIRWHGRGGQGVKTAATFLAEASFREGKYGQGFPDYGPERGGAPTAGYTRIDSDPINLHCAIVAPDMVVVLDDTLLDGVDVAQGVKDNGFVLINSALAPAEIRNKISNKKVPVWVVNATKIAIDEIKRPIPNMPMVGALLKAGNFLKMETVEAEVNEAFACKFKPEVIAGNLRAIKRAYEEVTKG